MGLMTGSLLEARVDHLAESRLEQKEGYGQETSSLQTPIVNQGDSGFALGVAVDYR